MSIKEDDPKIISFQSHLNKKGKQDLRSSHTANGLTQAERLVLALHQYEQMSVNEIAATLDLSESCVSQMIDHLKSDM